MGNNTLASKIKRLCIWGLCLSLGYLVVGAFLVSDYPLKQTLFDPEKTYNLLKDTLTLAAYFITPAIACLLFTDWRDQHRRINNEKVSSEIKELLGQILTLLNTQAISLINGEEYLKYRKKYFGHLIDLKKKNELINPNCEESSKFISKINDMSDLMHDFWLKLETQIIIHNELDYIKDLGSEYGDMRNHYRKSIQAAVNENSASLTKFKRIWEEIKILYV